MGFTIEMDRITVQVVDCTKSSIFCLVKTQKGFTF